MPFDGVVCKSIVNELSENLIGGRIERVLQPEKDEIVLNIRAKGQNLKLLISANANAPRIHLTNSSKENPMTPPVFCMLLRKHLQGGKILGVGFYDFERIISLEIESISEMGDFTIKKLIVEIMGKHSNIILINSENKILDAIWHIDNEISRVREIMPARTYLLPPSQDKQSPETLDIINLVKNAENFGDITMESYLLNNIKGFSPLLCKEICHLSKIAGKTKISTIDKSLLIGLINVLSELINTIKNNAFKPCLILDSLKKDKVIDFHCLNITQFENSKSLDSISNTIDSFFSSKDKSDRLKQKKQDIYKVINNNIDRSNKKINIHQNKLKEVNDRDNLKLYGELILANIRNISKGASSAYLLNYYSENNEYIDVPLDKDFSAQRNSQKYYKQYTKAKTAYEYATKQLQSTKTELSYLESVLHILDTCSTATEIDEIRQELSESGYISIKKKAQASKKIKLSAPYHYISSEGFSIYVGKNNKQNDLLTLKTASSNDIWLHTKDIPGSHVIIKKQHGEIPDSTLLEGAMLAAYYSKGKLSSHVEVDYTTVRNVKKPNGAKPGMVIYENHNTLIVTPDKDIIENMKHI